jgi:hypothetical protein
MEVVAMEVVAVADAAAVADAVSSRGSLKTR